MMTIRGDGDNTASPAAGRMMAGAQLNLWKVRLYAQANASATPTASIRTVL